jgi:outer membrane protein TolC
MRKIYFIIAFILGASQPAFAQSASACGQIRFPQDILDCALKNHPEVKNSEAALRRDESLKVMAKQLPNPELESSLLSGQPGAPQGVSVDISISQAIELGGKRKNRIKRAVATEQFTKAQVLESRELTALNTVLALYRLRQIRSELTGINEAARTYQYLLNNYQMRPQLAPEQEVSSTVFGLAADEGKLKRANLLQEQTALLQFLSLATGLEARVIVGRLPGFKNNWPKFSLSQQEQNLNSEMARSNADKAISEANLQLAKSQAWPDFKIGPSFLTQTKIAGQNSAAGINLGLTLPIFSQNKGGIEYAKRDLVKSHLFAQSVNRENQYERVKLVHQYGQALTALRQIKSAASVNGSHSKLESFFDEGLLSAALVIETHRQMTSLSEARHAQELTAIEALWRLFILDGNFQSQKI